MSAQCSLNGVINRQKAQRNKIMHDFCTNERQTVKKRLEFAAKLSSLQAPPITIKLQAASIEADIREIVVSPVGLDDTTNSEQIRKSGSGGYASF